MASNSVNARVEGGTLACALEGDVYAKAIGVFTYLCRHIR